MALVLIPARVLFDEARLLHFDDILTYDAAVLAHLVIHPMKVFRLQPRRTQSSRWTKVFRSLRWATLRSSRVSQSLPKKRFYSLGLYFYLLFYVFNVRIDRLFDAIVDLLVI